MSYLYRSNQTADGSHALVRMDLIRRGWIPLTPESRDAPYDLVVDRGNNHFESVQIKTIKKGGAFQCANRATGAKDNPYLSSDDKSYQGAIRRRRRYYYRDMRIDWMAGADIETSNVYYYRLETYRHYENINVFRVQPDTFPINAFVVNNMSGGVIGEPVEECVFYD